jgi:hypothetical protein
METNTNRLANLKPNNLKAWARANRSLAMTVAKAKAFAEIERERVDAYIAPIFARYGFKDEDGKAIENASRLYMCEDDAACKAFYAECELAHRANGWKGEEGCCPALVAEDLQCRAEQLLLDSLGRLSSVDGGDFCRSLELRAKALNLALTVCLGRLS